MVESITVSDKLKKVTKSLELLTKGQAEIKKEKELPKPLPPVKK